MNMSMAWDRMCAALLFPIIMVDVASGFSMSIVLSQGRGLRGNASMKLSGVALYISTPMRDAWRAMAK